MSSIYRCLAAVIAVFALAGGASGGQAPSAPPPSGHWVGSIEAGPGLAVEVDIERQGAGWRGTISIPAQLAKGVPLTEVTVKDTAVSFGLKGAPGEPRFSGELSKDGKVLSGTFVQGGGSVPMSMTWKGEAQFEKPVKSPPLSAALLGTWEGALDIKGTPLRLKLVLANGADGAIGTLYSLDQGNVEIPVTAISVQGPRLKVTVAMISGGFEGDVKGDEIAGTWTQGPATFPLTLKRAK
jgi:hypothetical protein